MDAILGLASIVIFIVGVITLIKPLAFIRVPTRKRAAMVTATGIVLFIVAGLMTEANRPSEELQPIAATSDQGEAPPQQVDPLKAEADRLRDEAATAENAREQRRQTAWSMIRKEYDRFADRMVVSGMPAGLEPHHFAARCLALGESSGAIDPTTREAMIRLWQLRYMLTALLSGPNEMANALAEHVASKLEFVHTWPPETDQICRELAPLAGEMADEADRITHEIVVVGSQGQS